LGYQIREELISSGRITLTQPCFAKTEGDLVKKGSIPEKFYKEVMKRLKKGV